MKRIFADTSYWVALFVPGDQWRTRARAVGATLQNVELVTTEEVLTELLNFGASLRSNGRRLLLQAVLDILRDPRVEVLPQSHASFQEGLELYERRSDKGYSLTDCISMSTMRRLGLQEVITHDHHFEQEGFVALLR